MTPRNKDTTQEGWREAIETWWNEREGFGLRGERAFEELGPRARKWLEAACEAGWTARDRTAEGGVTWAECANHDTCVLNRDSASWDDAAVEREAWASLIFECAVRFREYERNHAEKQPPDMVKSLRNREMAEKCEAALNALPPPPKGSGT